jgi:hypothetical protein
MNYIPAPYIARLDWMCPDCHVACEIIGIDGTVWACCPVCQHGLWCANAIVADHDHDESDAERRATIERLSRFILHSARTGEPIFVTPDGFGDFVVTYPADEVQR